MTQPNSNVYIGMPRSGRSPSKVVSCTFLLHELPAEGCLYNVALVHKLVVSGAGQHGQIFGLAGRNDRPRTRQAGGEHKLLPQFARTDPRKFSFAVRAVEPWNRLPDEMKLTANKEEKDPKTKDGWAANMV